MANQPAPDDLVEIIHPDVHVNKGIKPAVVTFAAFSQPGGWKDKGWKLPTDPKGS